MMAMAINPRRPIPIIRMTRTKVTTTSIRSITRSHTVYSIRTISNNNSHTGAAAIMMKRLLPHTGCTERGSHDVVAITMRMPTIRINKKGATTRVTSSMVIRTSTITTNITTKVPQLLVSNPSMVKPAMGEYLERAMQG